MNISIHGSREEGKTTLAMAKARERHAGIVVFDQRAMIEGVIVYGADELEMAIDENIWREGPIVFRYDSVDTDKEFAEFCSVLFPPRFTRGGFAVVIDEAGRLQSPTYCHPDLERAVKQHPTKPPREMVTVIQTMHTLSESCANLRSLMDEYYIFQLTSKSDLDSVEKLRGLPREVVENLEQHHCVHYFNKRVPEGMPQYYIVDDPAAWHIRATTQDEKNLDTSLESAEDKGDKGEWLI